MGLCCALISLSGVQSDYFGSGSGNPSRKLRTVLCGIIEKILMSWFFFSF